MKKIEAVKWVKSLFPEAELHISPYGKIDFRKKYRNSKGNFTLSRYEIGSHGGWFEFSVDCKSRPKGLLIIARN